jgi:hypothetical protein
MAHVSVEGQMGTDAGTQPGATRLALSRVRLVSSFNTRRELIVTGDTLGCRFSFLRPAEAPDTILQLVRYEWVNCRPAAKPIADELFHQAEHVYVD